MSHNRTQPEEIDHILMAMANDMNTPMTTGTQQSGTQHDSDEFSATTGFVYGVAQKRLSLADP